MNTTSLSSSLKLAGKVALVTGGSRGLGAAIAKRLAADGATVAITFSSSPTKATEVVQAIQAAGGKALAIKADAADAKAVRAAVQQVVSTFGGIDILVNNAGVGAFVSVEKTSLEQWRQVVDTNLTGVFLCCRHALPLMRLRGGGWIINVSSLASTSPFADGATYCASKAGLNAFTEALMQEVRQDGIRVAQDLPNGQRTSCSSGRIVRSTPCSSRTARSDCSTLSAVCSAGSVTSIIMA